MKEPTQISLCALWHSWIARACVVIISLKRPEDKYTVQELLKIQEEIAKNDSNVAEQEQLNHWKMHNNYCEA